MTGILYDMGSTIVIVRPAMALAAMTKRQQRQLDEATMMMLRYSLGVTGKYKIRCESFGGT